jgi:hypothetical protein
MSALAAFALVNAGIGAWSSYTSAKQQAAAQRQQAELDNLRANEILERNRINNELTLIEAQGLSSEQIVSGAARGIAGGSQATLGTVQKIQELAARKILRDTREAEFDALQARLGGQTRLEAAKEIQKAGAFNAASSLLSGAYQAGSLQLKNDVDTKSGASGQNVMKPQATSQLDSMRKK